MPHIPNTPNTFAGKCVLPIVAMPTRALGRPGSGHQAIFLAWAPGLSLVPKYLADLVQDF